MKLSRALFMLAVSVPTTASAGGLLLPGAGAKSTARAGAATVAADDGEAISLNPAGIAKAKGTTITLGFAAINYGMSFQRNGTYDTNDMEAEAYEGQRYGTVEDSSDPFGLGGFLPIPAFGIVSDLGGAVPKLHVGFGLYTTNAYPNRSMNEVNGKPYFVPQDSGGFDFPAFGEPPPPSRYDIIEQEALIVMPALTVAYELLPNLDVGARFQAGWAHLKSTVAVWGGLANYSEVIRKDGIFTLDAKDNFIYGWGLGANFRASPNIELGAHYNAQVDITGRGTAVSANGPGVDLSGQPVVILPVDDEAALCARGGTALVQKGCVELALPMSATIGGRYKFLDAKGAERGDVEVDVEWQNWGTERAGDFRVIVDAKVTPETLPDQGINLKENIVHHGLRDTFGVRAGGSWRFDQGANQVIVRGGAGYETAAAKKNWERADFDGAARTMITAGGSYKLPRVQFDVGFGFVLEGTRTDSRNCNPALMTPFEGCGSAKALQDIDDRGGPDPVNPLVTTEQQAENPINQGTYKSSYVLIMLGASTWF